MSTIASTRLTPTPPTAVEYSFDIHDICFACKRPMRIQSTAVALMAVSLLGLSCCGPPDNKKSAASQEMANCQEELNGIKDLSALRKARDKQEQESGKPFEGLQLALTINSMVTSSIDDGNADDLCYTQDTRENFAKLLKALTDNGMPPTVAFVAGDSFDPVLETQWLKSGNLLGNFTFDRRKSKKGDARDLVDNVAKADQMLAPLWKAFPTARKYLRYPHPKAISNSQDKALISFYLKQNGYVEVGSTIESPDRLFSQMYCGVLAKGNTGCANLIKANFFSLLLHVTSKARAEARDAAGREIKHVFTIHATQLTCDTLSEMLPWLKGLGARFISLDEALSDPFYAGSGGNKTSSASPAHDE